MTLAKTHYQEVDRPDAFLEFHLSDGTSRGVIFRDHEAKAAALAKGRAEIDRTAIEFGLLPRGATFVTHALAPEATAAIEGLRDPGAIDLSRFLATIRLTSAVKGVPNNSEHIDEQRDTERRTINPLAARHYESLIDTHMENVENDT